MSRLQACSLASVEAKAQAATRQGQPEPPAAPRCTDSQVLLLVLRPASHGWCDL